MHTMQPTLTSDDLARREILKAQGEASLARSRMHLAQARMHMERQERLELEEELRRERARRRRGLFGSRF
jgi:hypothetical protein